MKETQKAIVVGNAISPFDETMLAEAQTLYPLPEQGVGGGSINHYRQEGYIAGRSKADEEKDKRVRELEEALRNLRHGLFTDINSVNEYIDKVLK